MKKTLILIAAFSLLCACKSSDEAAAPTDEAPAADAPAVDAPAGEMAHATTGEMQKKPGPTRVRKVDPAHGDGHGHGDAATCTCATGTGGGTVWCDHCSVGYINGEKNADKEAVMTAMTAK